MFSMENQAGKIKTRIKKALQGLVMFSTHF